MRTWVALTALCAACGSPRAARDDVAGSGSGPRDAAPAVATVDAPPPKPKPKPERVEHAVWKAVDNRHAAHRYRDGEIVLDAADVGLTRYTRFSLPVAHWHIGKTVEGVRAAVADRIAQLEIPLDEQQSRSYGRLSARVHGSARQSLALVVNGRRSKDATVALQPGWQTIALPIAPGSLGIGENKLAFETEGGKENVAFEWLAVGPRPGAVLLPTKGDPREGAKFDGKGDAVQLAKDAMLIWYVTVPDGANFVAGVPAGCKLEVQARASDGSFAGGLLVKQEDREEARVDLTSQAGKVVGLTVTARECDVATITHPRITMHGAAVAAAPKGEPPRYIILWVMDALRADKIPIFTPGARAQTPNLDELAKSSVVYRQYYVQGNESQTSHSSVWTSLYPAVHNVRLAGEGGTWRIENKFDVLAQKLTDAGFYTVAATANGFVNEDGGYARGFKEYRNLIQESGLEYPIIYGEKVLDVALKQLDAHRNAGPTYLFTGTIDTHAPWIARKPWIDIYSPGPYTGPFQEYGTPKDLGFVPGSMGCAIIPPKVDIERLRAIYDSAISYHDLQVGRVVKQLTSWGIWDQTMLVITADHGDELFEDERCGHGGSLRDSLVRVPLLVHYPARFAPAIVDEGAEGVDIMPTMLDALGQPPLPAAQGESLVRPERLETRGWARPSYSSMFEFAHAMRIGRWKARVGYGATPILNDMVDDPDEKKDLATVRLVERRMMTDNLGMFLALRKLWTKRTWGVTTNVTAEGASALDGLVTP